MAKAFEASFQQKLKLKPQERWFTTGRVLWTVRHSTGKVTENQQEDCSVRVKIRGAYWNPCELWWSATDDISSGVWIFVTEYRMVINFATPCGWLELQEERRLQSCESIAVSFAHLQSLHLVTLKLYQKWASQYDVHCILLKEFVDITIQKIIKK